MCRVHERSKLSNNSSRTMWKVVILLDLKGKVFETCLKTVMFAIIFGAISGQTLKFNSYYY